MEYFDLVDEQGNPTGQKKLRSEVHRDGDWHKAINIWIMNPQKRILIQKRAATKDSYPNFWDVSCAGHINAGENALNTAIREAKEELGIDIKSQDLKYLFSVKEEHFLNEGKFIDREIREIYLYQTPEDNPELKLQKEEVAETKWITIPELQAMVGSPDLVPHEREYQILFEHFYAA